MRRFSLTSFFILTLGACSGGDIPVGQLAGALQQKSDGGPTGDGRSCSWLGTVFQPNQTDPPSSDLGGPYDVGDEFASPDGCNDCSCTRRGILCTVLACEPATPTACTDEGKICPDGSVVGRSGPDCEFTPCPDDTPSACTEEAKICPDGSSVGRSGPDCEFAPCP
jgi:hypothetical protein